MLYFALANDGFLYNLCDCGDFDAAEESAKDLDIEPIWIFDQDSAELMAATITIGIADNNKAVKAVTQ